MMACLKAFTLILICVCILQQLLQVNTQVKKGRGKKNQHNLSPKPKALPHNPKKSSSKNPNVDAVLFKSRFVKEDGMRCTWAATESSIEDGVAFVLSITCKKGTVLHCEYTAKPRLCPEITSNIDAFWKQISRSLKNQNKLCRDTKALIRARMCRMAPKGAHFALKTPPKVLPTPASKNNSCPNLHNREKMAEEYCGSSWSSFCTFFFAMVETEDC